MIIFVLDTKEESDKFTAIYEKYGKIICYTITRFIPDEHLIEDLSQEVYIRIFRNLSKIDADDDKRTRNYIITITRNLCKNYLRNQDKVKETSQEELILLHPEHDGFLEKIITKEQIHLLAREISKLKDIYRSVLELKYMNEFCNDEIADILKIEKKTVEVRLYRAKIILRERMKDE